MGLLARIWRGVGVAAIACLVLGILFGMFRAGDVTAYALVAAGGLGILGAVLRLIWWIGTVGGGADR